MSAKTWLKLLTPRQDNSASLGVSEAATISLKASAELLLHEFVLV